MKNIRTTLPKSLGHSTFFAIVLLTLSGLILAGGCDLGTYSERYSGPEAKPGAATDAQPDAESDASSDAE